MSGIPHLVLVDTDGTVLSEDGRGLVMADPAGGRYPWREAALPDEAAGGDDPVKLRASDVKLIEIACEQTVYSALKENKAGRMDHTGLQVLCS